MEGARHFVRLAARTLTDTKRPPVFGRSKYLLAMPLLGTGGGGGGPFSGEVIRLLLHSMREESAKADVDVAVVLNDGPAWAAAQNERSDADWAELPAAMRQAADDLAAKARNGDLVLFLGAGVSQGAGLPSWSTLLSVLAADRGRIASPVEQDALARLGELDRAALIKKRLRLDDGDGVRRGAAGRCPLSTTSTSRRPPPSSRV